MVTQMRRKGYDLGAMRKLPFIVTSKGTFRSKRIASVALLFISMIMVVTVGSYVLFALGT